MIDLRYRLVHPAAVAPRKAHDGDAGFDIYIIEKLEDLTDRTALYDTGVQIQVPPGYYVELVPRSSISRTGYTLANGVGIIDQGYTGNIKAAVTRASPDDTIELPFKGFQLIVRQTVPVRAVQVEAEFDSLERGSGGFGSTDVAVVVVP